MTKVSGLDFRCSEVRPPPCYDPKEKSNEIRRKIRVATLPGPLISAGLVVSFSVQAFTIANPVLRNKRYHLACRFVRECIINNVQFLKTAKSFESHPHRSLLRIRNEKRRSFR